MTVREVLPKSGIGVDGPFLIIAPPGNPVIALDARLLDHVELARRSPVAAFSTAAVATAAGIGCGFGLLPGAMFAASALACVAAERFAAGLRHRRSRDILLTLGDLEVALHVADGAADAKRVADLLQPYSRGAPISRPEVYEDARRRLHTQLAGRSKAEASPSEKVLKVGEQVVCVRDDFLVVGDLKSFDLKQVREYALRGANLPLPGGRLLQAALAFLVVAADARAKAGEDLEALSERVAAYERWTGRSVGR